MLQCTELVIPIMNDQLLQCTETVRYERCHYGLETSKNGNLQNVSENNEIEKQ